MIRASAKAAHGVLLGWGRVCHLLAELIFGLALLTAVLGAGLVWRLSRGPLDLDWLTRRIESALATPDGPRLAIGHVQLAWEGWRNGVDQPLDLRLQDVRAIGADGALRASLPRAAVSLSPAWLLLGRVVPRAIELDGPTLQLQRDADGAVSLDLGAGAPSGDEAAPPDNPFGALLTDLARPPQGDKSTETRLEARLSQLRRVLIRDATVLVRDRQLGAEWSAPSALIDLRRTADGTVLGQVEARLALAGQEAPLAIQARLSPGGSGALRFDVGAITPAALARAAPGLAPLAALSAPLALSGTLDLAAHLVPAAWSINAVAGAGSAHIGTGDVPLRGVVLTLSGANDHTLRADLAATLAGSANDPHLHVQLDGSRADGRIAAAVAVDLDRANFAELGRFWPPGLDHGVRDWLVENVTTGIGHDGHFKFRLGAPDDLSDAQLTEATGQIEGEGLTVSWLRPVPPLEGGAATLTFLGPDAMDIIGHAGHVGTLQMRAGTVHITGLSGHDQEGVITASIDGPIADVLALLKHPRLQMLDKHPLPLHEPAGSLAGVLHVGLPFKNKLTFEEISISATATLHAAHFGAVVAGRDLDAGEAQLMIDTQGMSAHGTAQLGHIPVDLRLGMDFRDGPPGQVTQHAEIAGRATDTQLNQAKIDTLGILHGAADITAGWQLHRGGAAEVRIHADTAAAVLEVAPLSWRKPAGVPAGLDALLRFDHDHLVAIDQVKADGAQLQLDARMDVKGGDLARMRIARAVLGQTDLRGEIGFPASPGAPWIVTLTGPLLDLSPRLSRETPRDDAADDAKDPPWITDLRFDRALFARGHPVTSFALHAESDGAVVRRAHLQTGGTSGLTLDIASDAAGRTLAGKTDDAGALLRDFDVIDDMQGGHLELTGRYDDAVKGHPLAGNATIENFRIIQAPALARLLQAMTLYGLADTLAGPGLGFSRLVAPFRLSHQRLELSDARAFSPALGLTAKGTLDLAAHSGEMEGTIVPAYFFNSLLGNLPVLGKIFSPEQGGGLFAATYRVRGPMKDPTVTVNPLAALTPGFLRGIFGGF